MTRPAAILGVLLLASCAGSREAEVAPDEHYGHRYDDRGPEGRRTLEVAPPAADVEFFYYPAVLDSVHFRPASVESDLAENGAVPVETVIKGSLPDACSELHDLKQERAGHIVRMRLEMRRPQGAVCAMVVRPFRFYVTLEGLYPPGSYTLKLNNRVYTFTVRGTGYSVEG